MRYRVWGDLSGRTGPQMGLSARVPHKQKTLTRSLSPEQPERELCRKSTPLPLSVLMEGSVPNRHENRNRAMIACREEVGYTHCVSTSSAEFREE
jgi:hypothetical protein